MATRKNQSKNARSRSKSTGRTHSGKARSSAKNTTRTRPAQRATRPPSPGMRPQTSRPARRQPRAAARGAAQAEPVIRQREEPPALNSAQWAPVWMAPLAEAWVDLTMDMARAATAMFFPTGHRRHGR